MIKYLTYQQVISIHDDLLKNFGGLSGIRDKNLLLSALEMPKIAFGNKKMYPSIFGKTAAYLYHLVQNHPFNDGNKRTAYVVVLVFLEINHATIKFEINDLEQIVLTTANGKLNKTQLIHFFKYGKLCKK
jgi:death-on-curing protein